MFKELGLGKKISLGHRVIGPIVIVLASLVVLSVACLTIIHEFKQNMEKMVEQDLPLVRTFSDATQRLLDQSLLFSGLQQSARSKNKDLFDKQVLAFKEVGEIFSDMMSESHRFVLEHQKKSSTADEAKEWGTVIGFINMLREEHSKFEDFHARMVVELRLRAFTEAGDEERSTEFDLEEHLEEILLQTKRMEDSLGSGLQRINVVAKTLIQGTMRLERLATYVLVPMVFLLGFLALGLSFSVVTKMGKKLDLVEEKIGYRSHYLRHLSAEVSIASQDLSASAIAQEVAISDACIVLKSIHDHAECNYELTRDAEHIIEACDKVVHETSDRVLSLREFIRSAMLSTEATARRLGDVRELAGKVQVFATNASVEASRVELSKPYVMFTEEIRHLVQEIEKNVQEGGHGLQDVADITREELHAFEQISREIVSVTKTTEIMVEKLHAISLASKNQTQDLDALQRTVDSISQLAHNYEESAKAGEVAGATIEKQADLLESIKREMAGIKVGEFFDRSSLLRRNDENGARSKRAKVSG